MDIDNITLDALTKLDPLEDLDMFEYLQFIDFSKSMPKEEALQIIINTVEGDFTQLSETLQEIAIKQEEILNKLN